MEKTCFNVPLICDDIKSSKEMTDAVALRAAVCIRARVFEFTHRPAGRGYRIASRGNVGGASR
jgi:hypothetical protein